jgi:hypothetical protein
VESQALFTDGTFGLVNTNKKHADMTDKEIRIKAKEILDKNTFSGYSKYYHVPIHYMKPAPDRYPYQYFWDTCFHIYIMTASGMGDMAKKCMKSLFAMQRKGGFVGHMLYWNRFIPHRITDIFQKRPSIKNLVSTQRNCKRTWISGSTIITSKEPIQGNIALERRHTRPF